MVLSYSREPSLGNRCATADELPICALESHPVLRFPYLYSQRKPWDHRLGLYRTFLRAWPTIKRRGLAPLGDEYIPFFDDEACPFD